MTLAEDLLAQAERMIRLEPRRPKQATLRRAVSTAYYALFHLLTEAGARSLVSPTPPGLQALTQRAFSHSDMKSACLAFRSSGLPPYLSGLLPTPLSADIRSVAEAFAALQQARHAADYDTTRRYTRQQAADLLEVARIAFTTWRRIEKTNEGRVFLASLLLWDKWRRS